MLLHPIATYSLRFSLPGTLLISSPNLAPHCFINPANQQHKQHKQNQKRRAFYFANLFFLLARAFFPSIVQGTTYIYIYSFPVPFPIEISANDRRNLFNGRFVMHIYVYACHTLRITAECCLLLLAQKSRGKQVWHVHKRCCCQGKKRRKEKEKRKNHVGIYPSDWTPDTQIRFFCKQTDRERQRDNVNKQRESYTRPARTRFGLTDLW